MLANELAFHVLGDERGSLVALEGERDIPFEIKRVYYIYSVDSDKPRGFHAHRKLRQMAFCLAGSCTMILDDGFSRESVAMSKPNVGIPIDPMIWHEMGEFSSDCILMVLADDVYDETDYIRDYSQFLEEVK